MAATKKDVFTELSHLRKLCDKSEQEEIEKDLASFYKYLKSERIYIYIFLTYLKYSKCDILYYCYF